ncbi:MAG TPA: serine hydrolase [Longimicrobiales bacterium]|nr:serine hydrolase [Longimicrobiales bacterium]
MVSRLAVIAACTASLLAAAPDSASAQRLQKLRVPLEQRSTRHQGTVGIFVKDLSTGEALSIRGSEQFPSASVIKLPILVELFQQIEHGPLELSDPLMLLAADQRPGSGVLQFLSTPHTLTLGDAALLMIMLSDNSATNLIIDKVGIRNVNARMDSLGLRRTRLHAKVFLGSSTTIDTAATRQWGFGVTTPEEMGTLFEKLYRGTVVSDTASKQMLDMLRKNWDYEEIPRLLPAGVAVAHKTGKLNASRSDCGIVFNPPRDYVLCIFTKDNKDQSWRIDTEARVTIGELARIVHDGMSAQ